VPLRLPPDPLSISKFFAGQGGWLRNSALGKTLLRVCNLVFYERQRVAGKTLNDMVGPTVVNSGEGLLARELTKTFEKRSSAPRSGRRPEVSLPLTVNQAARARSAGG